MHRMIAVVLLMCPLPLFARKAPDRHALEDQAVRKVVSLFMEAWNEHDAKKFAAVFAEDADFTNVSGASATGRAQVEEFHAPRFATTFKDTHMDSIDIKTRFIRSDVAAVDVHWKMTGANNPDGTPRPERFGLLSFVMVQNAGQWQIAVMHNLELAPLPPTK